MQANSRDRGVPVQGQGRAGDLFCLWSSECGQGLGSAVPLILLPFQFQVRPAPPGKVGSLVP